MKKTIRLTEDDLTRLVIRAINEQSQVSPQLRSRSMTGSDKMMDAVKPSSLTNLVNQSQGSAQLSKDGVTYSIQKSPTGKFKIFVTTPTIKTPTDASKVFKGGTTWKEYNTQQEAQNAINLLVRPSESDGIKEQMDVSSDSEYYQERKREVSIPFDDLSMLSSLASRFCENKENFPDCRQVRRIISRHSLFM
jgi:hypothetical protein